MYAWLDLGGRSIVATSLVINEKQVYRIIVREDEIYIIVINTVYI